MKRILVVGEKRRGLQRMLDLRACRASWDGATVASIPDALRALASDHFDAVVTEVDDARDDSFAFIEALLNEYPETARVVVSGNRRVGARLRALPASHDVVGAEEPIADLANAVERAIDVSELIRDHALKVMIDRLDTLPPAPAVYAELNRAFGDDDSSASSIAGIIEQDPALAMEILKVVNSALFGLRREIHNVAEAVSLLGFAMVRNLALSTAVYNSLGSGRDLSYFDVNALQSHSLETARIASRIIPDRRLKDDAYLAGLLHDVGKLVFVMIKPEFAERIARESAETGQPPIAVEAAIGGGLTHAEAGAYLLDSWGFTYPIIEAAAFHHDPSAVPQRGFDLLAAVYVANRLARDPESDCRPFIESLGIFDNVVSFPAADLRPTLRAPA